VTTPIQTDRQTGRPEGVEPSRKEADRHYVYVSVSCIYDDKHSRSLHIKEAIVSPMLYGRNAAAKRERER